MSQQESQKWSIWPKFKFFIRCSRSNRVFRSTTWLNIFACSILGMKVQFFKQELQWSVSMLTYYPSRCDLVIKMEWYIRLITFELVNSNFILRYSRLEWIIIQMRHPRMKKNEKSQWITLTGSNNRLRNKSQRVTMDHVKFLSVHDC